MKKFIEKLSLLLLLSCFVCFVSCDKDPKPVDPSTPTTPQKAVAALIEFAQSSSQFTATVKESGNNVDATGLNNTKNLYGAKNSYPIISCQELGDGTWLVTCNYGPTLMLCNDGYLRRGIINIVTTGLFTTTGTTMTLTFENFYQKGDWLSQEYKIDGTQVIVNEGPNAADPAKTDYKVIVTDGLIAYNTKEIQYSETTTRTLLPGSELCDNNWYITGEWNGVSSDNVSYTLTANSTPLHYRICCHFFQDGILNINVEGLSPFSIDYGYSEEDSDCDRKAQLNYPGIAPIVFDM